jgi:molecular chaperone DnaK (HSP70)
MTAIAIDFGTSNTVVCIQDPVTQAPQTLRFPGISRQFNLGDRPVSVVPSLVLVQSPDTWLFGDVVRSQRWLQKAPDRVFSAFKRELVTDFQPPPRDIDGQSYSPEQVAEAFLGHLWQQVLQQQITPSQLIFTVPVGAFERYADWFRTVGDRLQIADIRMVDESTAAALGYAVRRPGSLVLVVDFGGGTLDLSLVRTVADIGQHQALKADVIAKSDAYIGGVDIDQWIAEAYLQQQGKERSQVSALVWNTVLDRAERLKIRLSTESTATESWLDDDTFTAYEMRLTREDLAELLEERQLLEQIRQALDDVLAIALQKGVSKTEIDLVLLVGGSCQLVAVQQLLLSYFGRQRVKFHKPFEAVAHGALALSQLTQIDDYLHHTYAIRLWEPYSKTYSYYPLFERGTTYPCVRSEPLILQVAAEGQQDIRLDIGEVATVTQAEVQYDGLGRMSSTTLQRYDTYRSLQVDQNQVCLAHLDPPGQLGIDRITVQFAVNDQRVLLATVRDLLTDRVLLEDATVATLS